MQTNEFLKQFAAKYNVSEEEAEKLFTGALLE